MGKPKNKPKRERAEPVTRSEALKIKCPNCGAPAGVRCQNYKGQNKQLCKERRPMPGAPTDAPVDMKAGAAETSCEWAKEAARITAKDKAAAGLFEEYVEPTSAADLYWKWRYEKAKAAEHNLWVFPENEGLVVLRLAAIERKALELIGPEIGPKILAHINATYPLDYRSGIWRGLLRYGKPLTYDYREEPANNTMGKVIRAVQYAPEKPPLGAEEFDRLFPELDLREGLKDAPEPDDGGLFERTIGALRKGMG